MKHIENMVLGLCTLPLIQSCSHQKEVPRPNIVLIMSDDMGYSDIGCYGSEINTPNLNRLAQNGLRFTQFYNTARSCPTRASLLTGLYPHQAGIGHMVDLVDMNRGGEGYAGDLSKHAVTIAQVLKGAGYSTYMTGKWHVTPLFPDKQNPDKHNWPLQRGFDRFFGTIDGAGSFYDPNTLTSGNTFIAPGKDFFYIDAVNDTAVKFIEEHNSSNPFFIYMAHTTAHWPLQALPEDIAKYKGRYDIGWDSLRAERYQRMLKMGLIDKDWVLSKSYPDKKWADVEDKEFQVQCMEVYAAMIDRMDQGVGRVISALEKKGILENTLIIFLQDNGACAETYGFNRKYDPGIENQELKPMNPSDIQYDREPKYTRDGRPVRVGYGVVPGPANTYMGYSQNWANASNTPFRMFKHWIHEGGISTPLIIHWPAGVKNKGTFVSQPGQLPDIMATCVDVAGASYPENYNDEKIIPMEGVSLEPLCRNKRIDKDTLYWEHEGNRAIRAGDWKLVSKPFARPLQLDLVEILPTELWSLYNLDKDRTETNDLSGKYPDKVEKLALAWQKWAARVLVIPKPVDNNANRQSFSNAKPLD
jgi:arylsulfatase A-like enzyme